MRCSKCGHVIDDESLDYCAECGEPLNVQADEDDERTEVSQSRYAAEDEETAVTGTEDDNPDGAAPDYEERARPAPADSWGDGLSQAAGALFVAVTQVGGTLQGLLDDPRFRARLPGGSLTLVGVGLVGLGLVLSVAPPIPGIGLMGSGVVLLWGALAAVNEWRQVHEAPEYPGRPVPPLPPALANLPRELEHPAVGQTFALLVCAYALLMLGYGPISWVWMLAGGLLGYDQGRRYFVPPEDGSPEGEPGSASHPWVLAGVMLCSVSLLLPWTPGSTWASGMRGGELPLVALTQFTLLFLACSAVKHRGLGGLHPLFLTLMTVWLMLWFFLMKNSHCPGPWLFLPGVLTLVIVVARHLIPQRSPVAKESASDLDLQG
ncbi:zinc ribbon domain-containing protein [Cystobacter fuscus]|uniref:hypothetical protein n=1 Tax=Cystobacter fuscus TaxID=43 RepID=UPI002B2B626E|nr:zinc ribbon domain-containing protein [Cystobacter fuscus]